ncbi:MAG: lipoate--protein ligase family protein [Candidatus Hydrogenedentes bacterium]|nr:lipoate--protein ligase family protein [Candidatus Hydrogenedentota bacterium]
MRFLDYSFTRPEENLAYDEILLEMAENGRGEETLRVWESGVPFVVLGVSQVLRQEVYEKNCLDDRVAIMRRCSAGGCVLQGPGCLNFSLVLAHDRHPDLCTIRGSYCYILGAITAALANRGISAKHKGVSDMAIRGLKFSGNAQKRRRRHILHHGTVLYALDTQKIARYIREPIDRPQYRGTRDHHGFLTTVPLRSQDLKLVLCDAFNADPRPVKPGHNELEAAKNLAKETYRAQDWIRRR